MPTATTASTNLILRKVNEMETIEFKNQYFGMNLEVVADTSYHKGEYSEYEVLNTAYLKIGSQLVEITDSAMLAEVILFKGYFESVEQIAEYEKEAYAWKTY